MSKQKADKYIWLLQNNHLVHTFINTAICEGLPTYLHGIVLLDIGLNTHKPIHPFDVDANGIRVGLSFRQIHHIVTVPWNGVVNCYTENGTEVSLTDNNTAEKPEEIIDSNPSAEDAEVIHVDFSSRKRKT